MIAIPTKRRRFLKLSIVVLIVASFWFDVLKHFDKMGEITFKSDCNVVFVNHEEGCNVLIHTTNV